MASKKHVRAILEKQGICQEVYQLPEMGSEKEQSFKE